MILRLASAKLELRDRSDFVKQWKLLTHRPWNMLYVLILYQNLQYVCCFILKRCVGLIMVVFKSCKVIRKKRNVPCYIASAVRLVTRVPLELSRRNNHHYAQICTTALFYTLAPTCFGSSLPSSGSFWIWVTWKYRLIWWYII
jgi:hypothetical protein